MTFEEWMDISEVIFGETGMAIINQYFAGNISFENCVELLYTATNEEDIQKLQYFIRILNSIEE